VTVVHGFVGWSNLKTRCICLGRYPSQESHRDSANKVYCHKPDNM